MNTNSNTHTHTHEHKLTQHHQCGPVTCIHVHTHTHTRTHHIYPPPTHTASMWLSGAPTCRAVWGRTSRARWVLLKNARSDGPCCTFQCYDSSSMCQCASLGEQHASYGGRSYSRGVFNRFLQAPCPFCPTLASCVLW